MEASSAELLSHLCEHLYPPAYVASHTTQEEGPSDVSVVLEQLGAEEFVASVNQLSLGGPCSLARALNAIHCVSWVELAALAQGLTFLHAAVLEHKGRAILLPGPSQRGKSTLALALRGLGCRVYSDEYAPLDLEGRIVPFPRPLQIRYPQPAIVAIDVSAPMPPLLVKSIYYLNYSAGTKDLACGEISRGEMVLRLVENAIVSPSKQVGLLASLTRLTRGVRVYAGSRGEGEVAAKRLLELESISLDADE